MNSETQYVPARSAGWRALALCAVVVLVVFVRLRLLQIPLERDEGEYAYAGQLMLEGVPPYQMAWNMKLPGTYAAYAAIMAVFGQTIGGIHLGFLFANLGALTLLFFIARRLTGFWGAVTACASLRADVAQSQRSRPGRTRHAPGHAGGAGRLVVALARAGKRFRRGFVLERPLFWPGVFVQTARRCISACLAFA